MRHYKSTNVFVPSIASFSLYRELFLTPIFNNLIVLDFSHCLTSSILLLSFY